MRPQYAGPDIPSYVHHSFQLPSTVPNKAHISRNTLLLIPIIDFDRGNSNNRKMSDSLSKEFFLNIYHACYHDDIPDSTKVRRPVPIQIWKSVTSLRHWAPCAPADGTPTSVCLLLMFRMVWWGGCRSDFARTLEDVWWLPKKLNSDINQIIQKAIW